MCYEADIERTILDFMGSHTGKQNDLRFVRIICRMSLVYGFIPGFFMYFFIPPFEFIYKHMDIFGPTFAHDIRTALMQNFGILKHGMTVVYIISLCSFFSFPKNGNPGTAQ